MLKGAYWIIFNKRSSLLFNILIEIEISFNTSKQKISRQKESKDDIADSNPIDLRTGDSDLPYIGNVINVN
jgi:hypothetical protein